MRLFGFDITRTSKAVTPTYPVGDRGYWWHPVIHEPFTGAWQRNLEERQDTLLAHYAVYACITLIASDIAKCRIKLVQQNESGIWEEIENAAHSPVLRKPNDYQTRIQFIEQWLMSKLSSGNAYILKEQDARGVVVAMYVLDPHRVKTLVTDDGSVFYDLRPDNLSGVRDENFIVPARMIIHDMCTLRWHPLYGIPPLAAAALGASQGLNIQRQSIAFFRNNSRPSGIVTGPQRMTDDEKIKLKAMWDAGQSAENLGKVAIMSGDIKYTPIGANAVDSQLIDQLNISAQMVCSAFQVPGFMVGVGQMPAFNNIEQLSQQYYSQCLQKHFEAIELALDEGLGLNVIPGKVYGTEFDLDVLLRMDTATRIKTYSEAVKGGIFKPNDARKLFDLPEVVGGDECYLQQQNFSLAALAKRDAREDPFASGSSQISAPDGGAQDGTTPDNQQQQGDGEDSQDQGSDDEELAAAKQFAAWELKKQLDKLAA